MKKEQIRNWRALQKWKGVQDAMSGKNDQKCGIYTYKKTVRLFICIIQIC